MALPDLREIISRGIGRTPFEQRCSNVPPGFNGMEGNGTIIVPLVYLHPPYYALLEIIIETRSIEFYHSLSTPFKRDHRISLELHYSVLCIRNYPCIQ